MAAIEKTSPLTRTDYTNINASLARLNQVLPEIEFLDSIGFDVGEYKTRHEQLLARLEAFKKRYFPNQA